MVIRNLPLLERFSVRLVGGSASIDPAQVRARCRDYERLFDDLDGIIAAAS